MLTYTKEWIKFNRENLVWSKMFKQNKKIKDRGKYVKTNN